MASEKRRSAAEIIAFHFSSDIADIRDGLYQHYRPAVYVVGNDYYCCPPAGQKPSKVPPGAAWERVAEYYGRTVYVSKAVG